jgi:two-component system LytT family response regulator
MSRLIQAPRIAFKTKGRILFLDLAEIVAVQAEGNYVSLRHQPNPYFLHESLSSMAEKLKPTVLFASTARSS